MTRRLHLWLFIAGGILVATMLVVLVAPRASSEPDGLGRVAIDEGFAAAEDPHALEDLPVAGYAVEGVDDEGVGTGLAGLIGVAVTFVSAAGGLFLLLRLGGRCSAGAAAVD